MGKNALVDSEPVNHGSYGYDPDKNPGRLSQIPSTPHPLRIRGKNALVDSEPVNHGSHGYDLDKTPKPVVLNPIHSLSVVKNVLVDSKSINHGSHGYDPDNKPRPVVSNPFPIHSLSVVKTPWSIPNFDIPPPPPQKKIR